MPEQQLGLYQGKKPQLVALEFYEFVPVVWRAEGPPVVEVFAYFTPGRPQIDARKLTFLGAVLAAIRH
eukprot:11195920-Lingulodinium_polyedra.AAC.1